MVDHVLEADVVVQVGLDAQVLELAHLLLLECQGALNQDDGLPLLLLRTHTHALGLGLLGQVEGDLALRVPVVQALAHQGEVLTLGILLVDVPLVRHRSVGFEGGRALIEEEVLQVDFIHVARAQLVDYALLELPLAAEVGSPDANYERFVEVEGILVLVELGHFGLVRVFGVGVEGVGRLGNRF